MLVLNMAVKIQCKTCHRSLYATVDYYEESIVVTVAPCDICLPLARNAGFDEGYSLGRNACQTEKE